MGLLLEICIVLLIVYIVRFRAARSRNEDLKSEVSHLQNQLDNSYQNFRNLLQAFDNNRNVISEQEKIIDKLNLRVQSILRYAEDGLSHFSAEELSHIPKGVTFDEYLYPHLYNDQQVERDFTVYVAPTGTCYHRTLGCHRAYDAIHLYKGLQLYRPCPSCVEDFVINYKIPSWYYTYLLWKHLEKMPKDPERLSSITIQERDNLETSYASSRATPHSFSQSSSSHNNVKEKPDKRNFFPYILTSVITIVSVLCINFALAQQNTDSFEIVQKRFITNQLSTQYDAGYDNGQRAGYEEGYEDGVQYGYGSGLTLKYFSGSDSYNHGYENGYNAGFIDGHDEGYRDVSDESNYDKGFNDGYEKCYNEYEDRISFSHLVDTIIPYITTFIVIWFFYLLMSRIIKLTIASDAPEKVGLVKRVFSALIIAILVMIIIYLSQSFNFPPMHTK